MKFAAILEMLKELHGSPNFLVTPRKPKQTCKSGSHPAIFYPVIHVTSKVATIVSWHYLDVLLLQLECSLHANNGSGLPRPRPTVMSHPTTYLKYRVTYPHSNGIHLLFYYLAYLIYLTMSTTASILELILFLEIKLHLK